MAGEWDSWSTYATSKPMLLQSFAVLQEQYPYAADDDYHYERERYRADWYREGITKETALWHVHYIRSTYSLYLSAAYNNTNIRLDGSPTLAATTVNMKNFYYPPSATIYGGRHFIVDGKWDTIYTVTEDCATAGAGPSYTCAVKISPAVDAGLAAISDNTKVFFFIPREPKISLTSHPRQWKIEYSEEAVSTYILMPMCDRWTSIGSTP